MRGKWRQQGNFRAPIERRLPKHRRIAPRDSGQSNSDYGLVGNLNDTCWKQTISALTSTKLGSASF